MIGHECSMWSSIKHWVALSFYQKVDSLEDNCLENFYPEKAEGLEEEQTLYNGYYSIIKY